MKRTTLSMTKVGLAVFLGLAALVLNGAEATDLLTPSKRAEMLVQATKAQLPRNATDVELPNPFYPAGFGEAAVSAPTTGAAPAASAPTAGARTGQALLQAIATSIKPSGYFVLGGQPTLVFGQKRVKAGGILTITFEGVEYTLEVTSLDRTHFTLRLNGEEFTRPIK